MVALNRLPVQYLDYSLHFETIKAIKQLRFAIACITLHMYRSTKQKNVLYGHKVGHTFVFNFIQRAAQ